MGKVESYNLQNDILELLRQGESLRSIERIFKKQNIVVSRNTIRNWLKENHNLLDQMVKTNEKVKERVVHNFLDCSEQLLFMNKESMFLYEQAKQENDFLNSFRALDQMGKNLMLYHKLIGSPEDQPDDYQTRISDAGDLDTLLESVKKLKATAPSK